MIAIPNPALRVISLATPLALAVACAVAIAGEGDKALDELVGELEKETRKAPDLANLRTARLTLVTQWDLVQPAQPDPKAPKTECLWKETDGLAAPLSAKPLAAAVDVPEDGEYRVFLRQMLGPDAVHPVTCTLAAQTHVFGKVRLARGTTGREIEDSAPVRFEDEPARLAPPTKPLPVWEYWDVKLAKGVSTLTLASEDAAARVHAVFLSTSKDFRPSLAGDPAANTLRRLFLRFRLTESDAPVKDCAMTAALTYHWGRGVRGAKEPVWGWDLGGVKPAPPKTWSAFRDISDGVINGSGPWSTCRLSFSNVRNGKAELQFAWFAHEAAVLSTVPVAVAGGQSMLRVPHGVGYVKPAGGKAVAGVWDGSHFAGVLTEEQLVRNYLAWGNEAVAKLKLPRDHPLPRLLRFYAGCGVSAPYRDAVVEMLGRLGINWIEGAPPAVAQKLGLITDASLWHVGPGKAAGAAAGMSAEARAKVAKIKIADEIGTYTEPEVINADAAKLAAFREYLAGQAQDQKPDEFYGSKLDELKCIGKLPEHASLAQRRLFYHSQRFCHVITAREYAAHTKELATLFPNARAYNNYSPHPPMFGGTMNHTDWFVVTRHGGQSLAWGEDWATGGSWGMGTFQSVSYYAALVDCAARRTGCPSGFYVCVNCGNAARKIFSCAAQGLTWLHLYDWGPIDNWAEGSNSWSEHQGEYSQVAAATYALGPADEIVAKGAREPRQAAILYNRSHEIWNGAEGRFIHDCMWTFVALKNSHYPVDIILEDDVTPEELKRYKVVFIWGFNLDRRHLAALRTWVEGGGTLIASAGAAMRDVYNEPLEDAVALFGARQRLPGPEDKSSRAKARFTNSAITPEAELTANGLTAILAPTTGKQVAAFDGGECAAVASELGKGRTLLLGVQPGFVFHANGGALSPAREWLAFPVLKTLGRPRAELLYYASEVTLFEHPGGLAVLLTDFGYDKQPKDGVVLSVEPRREIRSVTSALKGPLPFERNGERVEVKVPVLEAVDVVILR
ncbi:MAG: beta-galactosidase trimerization domain-containing protein [Planctomycetota bacterium]|nr:beta-galactosidase trimerization domain-containing protein [Planctomycetota bacterium]